MAAYVSAELVGGPDDIALSQLSRNPDFMGLRRLERAIEKNEGDGPAVVDALIAEAEAAEAALEPLVEAVDAARMAVPFDAAALVAAQQAVRDVTQPILGEADALAQNDAWAALVEAAAADDAPAA